MTKRISFADLEAHFFEILAHVCRGEKFSITQKRRVVARIVPAGDAGADKEAIEALEGLATLERRGDSIEKMKAFAELHRL